MKKRIFNLIILDESGSMECISKEAVNGVNETIQTIRKAQKEHVNQEHFVTLVTFNTEVRTIADCIPAGEAEEMSEKDYRPDCCTALYDAIGFSTTSLHKRVSEDDNVLVTIVTDGLENASVEFEGKQIKKLIESLKKENWVFTYMGSDHDVEAAAEALSIRNRMNFDHTAKGVEDAFCCMCQSRAELYDKIDKGCFNQEEENENFFNNIKSKIKRK